MTRTKIDLSDRLSEVRVWIDQGLNAHEIAAHLGVSSVTARNFLNANRLKCQRKPPTAAQLAAKAKGKLGANYSLSISGADKQAIARLNEKESEGLRKVLRGVIQTFLKELG